MRCRILIILLLLNLKAFSWGFYGHKKINEIAVYTLPKPLFGFYKRNVNYITAHATDADSRRYIMHEEACRHFMDGDHYESSAPFDTVPHFYKDACLKYSEDSLLVHGIVPWHIQLMVYKLTEAFKNKETDKILKLSADLGHYIGDLHVPLHATSNYNGQKTAQKGIHALWESRLPELYFENYDMFTGLAFYNTNPKDSIWLAFGKSFSLVDSVLSTEKNISAKFSDDAKYSWEKRGSATVRVYSEAFCKAYHLALGSMVEDRMRASVIMLGSLWYTCWINAGQPDLDHMPLPETPPPANEEIIPVKETMLGREEE